MTTLLERRGAGLGGPGISYAENPSKTTRAGQALSAVLGALPPNSEERLGLSRKLELLGRETDESIFDAELWRIAVREEARGNSDFALRAYAWLAENGDVEARARAAESLSHANGMGGAGSRFEDLSRRFARETGDPATLLAMAVGGGVYRATRLAAMTRLAGGAGALGQGLGLKIAGSAAGLAVEAPAFTAVARWCGGRGISDAGFKEELLSSYLVLGGLKAMGGAATRLSQGLGRPAPERWIGIGGMYGGIMAGHGLETAVGLREWRPGGAEWAEGLALLVQFRASGKILNQLGGARYRGLERELDLRADRLAEWGAIDRVQAANDGLYPKILPAANGPHREAEAIDLKMAVGWEVTHLKSEPASPRGLRVLASQGPADGDSGAVPVAVNRRQQGRNIEIEVTQKLEAAKEVPGKSSAPKEPARSGEGWAYLRDYGRGLYRLQVSELPEGRRGVIPTSYVSELFLNPTGRNAGQLTVVVESLRDEPGYPKRHILQIERDQWKDLGFVWPEASRAFPILSRQVIALESGDTILEGWFGRLEGYARQLPWNNEQIREIGVLIGQCEELGAVMKRPLPRLDRFLEAYGDRMILSEPKAPAAREMTWLSLHSRQGIQVSLRRITDEGGIPQGISSAKAVVGRLMGQESDPQRNTSRGAIRIQALQQGYYSLRLQYQEKGRYPTLDLIVNSENARALGLEIVKEKLLIPTEPMPAVEFKVLGKATVERPWVTLFSPQGDSLSLQSDGWKARHHALLMDGEAVYGTLIPKGDPRFGDALLAPSLEGGAGAVYKFELIYRSRSGLERMVDISLSASQAQSLGLELDGWNLRIPKKSYLLVKVQEDGSASR